MNDFNVDCTVALTGVSASTHVAKGETDLVAAFERTRVANEALLSMRAQRGDKQQLSRDEMITDDLLLTALTLARDAYLDILKAHVAAHGKTDDQSPQELGGTKTENETPCP